MPETLKLKLAIDRYDRHFPFFDGTVSPPDGLELEVLQVGQSQTCRDGTHRHERMHRDGEFDVCEFGIAPYLMLVDRDPKLPFVALPVFPRRLFSQSQIFVREDSGISEPKDLAGRRVALRSFNTTLCVLAKGDLKFHYDVPWEDIVWRPSKPDIAHYENKKGVRIEPLPETMNEDQAIERGEVDAVIVPNLPKAMAKPDEAGTAKVRRLFPDFISEAAQYFQAHRSYPIMHLVVIRRDLFERQPWIGRAIVDLFAQAKAVSDEYLDDPNWSRLAWGRHYLERQQELLDDPWPVGFIRNRENISRFIKYLADQNLVSENITPEALFPEALHDL
jgi:4,5-dihydroxyphthalate decarboxylase